MGSGDTSRLGLQYPLQTDPTDVPDDVRTPLQTLDAETVVFVPPCTFANLPASWPTGGRLCYVTDAGSIYYDAGAPYGWVVVSQPIPVTTYIYATGSWTPPPLVNNVDLILIGGGGGGGGGSSAVGSSTPLGGGGGGGGEFAQYWGVVVTAGTPVTTIIGSGGTGGSGSTSNGTNGANGGTTSFGTYTAVGGGGGGAALVSGAPGILFGNPGLTGACNGGWGASASGASAGSNGDGGGGGGAGSPSGNGASQNFSGLYGTSSYPTRHFASSCAPNVEYANQAFSFGTWHGGNARFGYCAGGNGGAGGGTNSNFDNNPAGLVAGTAGAANTGNGGAGGGGNNAGGNGGSGLVIIRYWIG